MNKFFLILKILLYRDLTINCTKKKPDGVREIKEC